MYLAVEEPSRSVATLSCPALKSIQYDAIILYTEGLHSSRKLQMRRMVIDRAVRQEYQH